VNHWSHLTSGTWNHSFGRCYEGVVPRLLANTRANAPVAASNTASMNSTTNRAHSCGRNEQSPSSPRPVDSAMDPDAPSLADLAFGLELDDSCFLDNGSVAAAFGETEAVDKKAKSKTVLDRPAHADSCTSSSRASSPRDVVSASFVGIAAREYFLKRASTITTPRYAAGPRCCATPHPLMESCGFFGGAAQQHRMPTPHAVCCLAPDEPF
jgi:hypothetical protein